MYAVEASGGGVRLDPGASAYFASRLLKVDMQDEDEQIAAVQQNLGYRFDDRALLVDALTHRSFANERRHLARTDNDRLEFLGDAVLQWAVSSLLWDRYPQASAGEMTRRRADLVCEDGLAQVAVELGIPDALRLGKGEVRSGGRSKPRLLASAFEACVAAIYLDGGSPAALEVCERLFGNRMGDRAPGSRDYKTRLQELLQRHGLERPQYEVLATSGPDHARRFQVALLISGRKVAEAHGRSKGEAEQAAAELGLHEMDSVVASEAPDCTASAATSPLAASAALDTPSSDNGRAE